MRVPDQWHCDVQAGAPLRLDQLLQLAEMKQVKAVSLTHSSAVKVTFVGDKGDDARPAASGAAGGVQPAAVQCVSPYGHRGLQDPNAGVPLVVHPQYPAGQLPPSYYGQPPPPSYYSQPPPQLPAPPTLQQPRPTLQPPALLQPQLRPPQPYYGQPPGPPPMVPLAGGRPPRGYQRRKSCCIL
ncbi:uncharacterized protein LOC131156033 [Malania oleifera]|uniref:uncharacterized protein LOC131156033 n=1 Tax=Malania oleifera TaxID=397392 RepID=UPI0025AE8B91|nr:uncharacterized protein LOC131156033 [Malania oleifera]